MKYSLCVSCLLTPPKTYASLILRSSELQPHKLNRPQHFESCNCVLQRIQEKTTVGTEIEVKLIPQKYFFRFRFRFDINWTDDLSLSCPHRYFTLNFTFAFAFVTLTVINSEVILFPFALIAVNGSQDPILTPTPQPRNSSLRIFCLLQPGLEWAFLLRRTWSGQKLLPRQFAGLSLS